MKFEKALFIQLKMLGDILMLSPAIRAFKQRYPETLIDIAVEPPGEDLVRLNPHVNQAISIGRSKWYNLSHQYGIFKQIRGNGYDLVIDFLGNPRSAHYTFFSGASTRLGYDDAQLSYAYNMKNRRLHGYSAYSKLSFLDIIDVKSDDYSLEFYPDTNAGMPPEFQKLRGEKLLAISPVSYVEKKVWPTANFAQIASFLNERYNFYPVVIVGPRERGFLDEYGKHSKCDYLPLCIESLMVLGSVLKECQLFVGNDNGPKHIAVAMGLPTFTVYGHISDPVCWNYPDDPRHRFIGGLNQPDCLPIADIKADTVISRLDEFVNSAGL